MSSDPTRVYEKRDLDRLILSVEWRPELCVHCENCIRGLPAVFNMEARPWVNVNGASAEEINRQCGECPDGALKCVMAS